MVLKSVYPIINDQVVDFSALEKFIHYLLYSELKIDPKEHGFIILEYPFTSKIQKEKMCEILFETFSIPSVLFLDVTLADILYTGKKTGLVIHIASNNTYIAPIWEATPLNSHIKKINIGYTNIIEMLNKLFLKKGISFLTSREREILNDIREKLCYVALNPETEKCERNYILPDGESIHLENELFLSSEIFFSPKMIGKENKSLDIEIYDTIMNLDSEIREKIAKDIILSGTAITGMSERLNNELEKLISFKFKLIQADKYSSWLGASILGELKSIQYPSKYWFSRKEYYEYGPELVHSKPRDFLKDI
ncbi:MAG: hypothetical protein ACTSO9_15620 [Candidatus Helarchaeota archaeon]